MANVPDGLLYTATHQWAKIDGNIVTVGITDFAQEQLGELSLVELDPDDLVGTEVTAVVIENNEPQSDPIDDISIESQKAVGDVYCPVSGKIVEVNESLDDEPEKVNEDPYGEGWLFKVEASNLDADKAKLMDAAAYKSYIESL
ncbi:MAG: glycine cleavage system protein H [Promethearchaeota archaeon]